MGIGFASSFVVSSLSFSFTRVDGVSISLWHHDVSDKGEGRGGASRDHVPLRQETLRRFPISHAAVRSSILSDGHDAVPSPAAASTSDAERKGEREEGQLSSSLTSAPEDDEMTVAFRSGFSHVEKRLVIPPPCVIYEKATTTEEKFVFWWSKINRKRWNEGVFAFHRSSHFSLEDVSVCVRHNWEYPTRKRIAKNNNE